MNTKEKIKELKDLQKRLPIAGMYDDRYDELRIKIDEAVDELERFQKIEPIIEEMVKQCEKLK